MGVAGQSHASAALAPREKSSVPIRLNYHRIERGILNARDSS